jgi:hypothetical protein
VDNTILRNKWTAGVLLPGGLMLWGIWSAKAQEIVIPMRWVDKLPIYRDIPLHGWPAVFVALALVSLSLACHFEGFWGQFPKWERFTSLAFRGAIWLAGILFGIGITVWIAEMLAELSR